MNKKEMLKKIEELKDYVEAMPDERRHLDDWVVIDSEDVGYFIGAQMRILCLNNKEMAEKAHLTEGRISQILSGKTQLNLKTINKMLNLLDYQMVIKKKP
jgi:hypothetical protein